MKSFLAVATTAALGLAAFDAQAVVVTPSTDLPPPVTEAGALPDPMVVAGLVRIDFAGNNFDGMTPSALSPYAGTPFEDVALYHSVSAGAEAKYAFDRLQTTFSLLYGSPDDFNNLAFLLDGTEVFSLAGDALVPPGTLGMGAVYVTIADILFDEVRLTSGGDAFEFTNVSSVAMIPLPATLPLLLGALAGIGLARRRAA